MYDTNTYLLLHFPFFILSYSDTTLQFCLYSLSVSTVAQVIILSHINLPGLLSCLCYSSFSTLLHSDWLSDAVLLWYANACSRQTICISRYCKTQAEETEAGPAILKICKLFVLFLFLLFASALASTLKICCLFSGFFCRLVSFLFAYSATVAVAVHANHPLLLLFILKKLEMQSASFPACQMIFPRKFLLNSGCLFDQTSMV